MVINFCFADEVPHGCFSNFSPHGFELGGLYWPTSEHFYQAQKFPSGPHAERIRLAESPALAAELGNSRAHARRRDWHEIKLSTMRGAVLRKFETHADIRAILLDTGEARLVEGSPNDYFWGAGADGSGKNWLGLILMDVRESLRLALARSARCFTPAGSVAVPRGHGWSVADR